MATGSVVSSGIEETSRFGDLFLIKISSSEDLFPIKSSQMESSPDQQAGCSDARGRPPRLGLFHVESRGPTCSGEELSLIIESFASAPSLSSIASFHPESLGQASTGQLLFIVFFFNTVAIFYLITWFPQVKTKVGSCTVWCCRHSPQNRELVITGDKTWKKFVYHQNITFNNTEINHNIANHQVSIF